MQRIGSIASEKEIIMVKKICKQCGIEFDAKQKKVQFHNMDCALKYKRENGIGFHGLKSKR